MDTVELVKFLIDKGHSYKLYELISGTSKYCVDNPTDAVLITEENRIYWQLAMDHLRAIHNQDAVTKNNQYPEEFNQWTLLGCPGLSKTELEVMLKEHEIVL